MAKGHSKKRTKSKSRAAPADDGSTALCESLNLTPHQYVQVALHNMGLGEHAPARAGRARSSSRARTDGGKSGHTSREASQEPRRAKAQEPRQAKDPFRERVRKRCSDACTRYQSSDEFDTVPYTRADFLAAAYQLESENDHKTLVIDHLRVHGTEISKWYEMSEKEFPDQSKEALKKKILTPKGKWGQLWSDALTEMESSQYPWDEHFSQHELRALMIQQSHDTKAEKDLTLRDYVRSHSTSNDDSKRIADENYPHDKKTRQPYVRKQHLPAPATSTRRTARTTTRRTARTTTSPRTFLSTFLRSNPCREHHERLNLRQDIHC